MATKTVPTELRDVESYRIADDRLAELKSELSDAEQAVSDAESRLSIVGSIDVEAAKLLAGGAGSESIKSLQDDGALRLKVGDLRRKASVLRRAIELQRDVLRQEQYRASAAIAQAAKPGYEKIVAKLAACLATLRDLIVEERAYRESLNEREIKWLGTFQPAAVGGYTENHVAAWHAEARAAGYKV